MRRQDDWITALYHKEIITNTNPPEYKEGDLYYWEKDQMVMTEHYHKWRGWRQYTRRDSRRGLRRFVRRSR